MSTKLGKHLKKIRESLGLTLRKVEESTGISNGYINQIETGHVKQPSPRYLYKLAELYKVSYEELCAFAEYLLPQKDSEPKMTGIAFSLLQNLSTEENDELMDYLKYIRARQKKKK